MGQVFDARYLRRFAIYSRQEGDRACRSPGLSPRHADRRAAGMGKASPSQCRQPRKRRLGNLMIMDAFVREHAWFFTFWGAIVLFGIIEFLFPQFPETADRARRWPTNFGLGILNGLIVSAVPVASVGAAQWAAAHDIGLLNWIAAPWWLALPCTLLIKSLSQYAFHFLSHKVPLLWRLHRVHHCDVHLDVSSSLRNHPLELIASSAFVIPIVVVCGL